jgi:tRNA threonylcarbamoyladenosine biosynthesis protein TsaB
VNGTWLGIDTATDHAGFALVTEAEVLEAWTRRTRRGHTSQLAPRINEALAALELDAATLAGVAVAIGPGSYTGLRVGLALAKGLALAASLPIVGVPTLDAIAAPYSAPYLDRVRTLWAVVPAGRGRVVGAPYRPGETWPDPEGLAPATLATLLAGAEPGDWLAGEIGRADRLAASDAGLLVLPAASGTVRAAWIAHLGRERVAPAVDAEAMLARVAALEPAYPAQPRAEGA